LPSQLDVIVGSGGVISNAPRRAQAMLMLIDSIQPEGVSRLFVDSVFMMPQLGAISDLRPEIALEVLLKDCLIPLGTCIAPKAEPRPNELLAVVTLSLPDGRTERVDLRGGDLLRLPLAAGERAGFTVEPRRGVDMGAGPGRRVSGEVAGGEVGLVLDGRGRPIRFPAKPQQRAAAVLEWLKALEGYDLGLLTRYAQIYAGGDRA